MAAVYDFVSGSRIPDSPQRVRRVRRGIRALTTTARNLVGIAWDLAIAVLGIGSLAAFCLLVPFMIKMAAENPFYGLCVFFILKGMFVVILEIRNGMREG